MSNSDNASPRISRRTLLKAGVAGAGALIVTRWLYRSTTIPDVTDVRLTALDVKARTIIGAIAPALLDGALPAGADAASAVREIIMGVDQAVSGLPPAMRNELDQLFSLLEFAPTRCLLAGVWTPWASASASSIAAFLASWRDSRFALLQSAYGALHQLVLASWYGNPRAWGAIGYAGPPVLAAT